MAKFRILVPCGSGIASSTICAQKIRKGLGERGLDVEVKQLAFRELQGEIGKADLIVSITPGLKSDLNIPVVNGLPLLTGVGEKAVFDEIISKLTGGTKQ
ncbi:MAG: PTS sugar transporter subunit IIB [Candidatus Fermentithermobacillus carboniphilus]|uniref:PTS sugar transporter subunit IIB n=1 Tax=Candidatus Fermentithermobacillus carboniphilus TaxID=3085328 RepID=A0AAT9LCZ4_9FIRM|nr:MAG: PTS sugar transporter subunit IIB [Candidatus Fermentithermobacillus carboniphilus]